MFALVVAALALDEIDDLVRKLGADDVDAREAATVELKSKGKAVEPRLRVALKIADDPEIAARLGVVLAYLADLVEADGVLLVINAHRVGVERADAFDAERGRWRGPWDGTARPVDRILRHSDGVFVCFLPGRPTVRYQKSRPGDLLLPLLRAEIARPVDLDLPIGFELLGLCSGYPELIPALEERAKKSSDPLVKRLCQRAIEKQKEVPCSTSP